MSASLERKFLSRNLCHRMSPLHPLSNSDASIFYDNSTLGLTWLQLKETLGLHLNW